MGRNRRNQGKFRRRERLTPQLKAVIGLAVSEKSSGRHYNEWSSRGEATVFFRPSSMAASGNVAASRNRADPRGHSGHPEQASGQRKTDETHRRRAQRERARLVFQHHGGRCAGVDQKVSRAASGDSSPAFPFG